MPYYDIFKILDNPRRLQPIALNRRGNIGLTKKGQLLANNYREDDSPGLFTLPARPNTDYTKNKTKFALWYVSNCDSAGTHYRNELVKELRKYIPIDVFGSVGECSEVGQKQDPCYHNQTCSHQMMSSYKFYLSFENSQCNYYITGKHTYSVKYLCLFWYFNLFNDAVLCINCLVILQFSEKFYLPLMVGTLPVAFSAPLNHYEIIAPKNSFLHVSNFSSIENLANYMKYLDKNDKEYNR